MKTSETLTKIAPALVQAQSNIKYAIENAKNPHLKNNYADLSSVIDAVKESLNDVGIAFLQTPSPSDDGKLHLTTRLLHTSGEWIEDTATCPLPKQDPQGFGSALTYLRRYSLSAICGLYADDDDGDRATLRPQNAFVDVAALCKAITDTKNADELRKAFATAFKSVKGTPGQAQVQKVYDEMKSLFEENK
jgi:hypothetical protein